MVHTWPRLFCVSFLRAFQETACRLLLLLALIGALSESTSADDWFRWRGPDLTGISEETGWSTNWPVEGPKQLWKAAVGIGFSSVSVSAGRVYTMGNSEGKDTVFCFDSDSGKPLWTYSYACGLRPQYYEGGTSATPTIDGSRCFTLSKEGHVFCFNSADGKVVWQKELVRETGVPMPRWGFASSPLIQGELLILNAGSAGMSLDKSSGKVVWASEKAPGGYASPVPLQLGNQRCLLIFSAKALICVALEDGHLLWQLPWISHWDLNIPDPIVVGDRVFISSFDQGGALLKVDIKGATVLWHNQNLANHFSSSVLIGGNLYGFHGNTDKPPAELRCLDFVSGEIRWQHAGLGFGALSAADGKLILISEKGELLVAPALATAFQPIARAQVLGGKCWITPVLSNGRIYCRNAQGSLVCLDVRPQAAEGNKH
jgi:outer membrane protein assembly factor BamB